MTGRSALRLRLSEFLGRDFQFEEGPVVSDGLEVGWHAQAVQMSRADAFAGGTSRSRDEARRIAVAEALERRLVSRMASRPIYRTGFLLEEFPTTCGFACGFEDHPVRMRSVAEAVERWAWSKWIDDRFPLEEMAVDLRKLSSWIRGLLGPFNEVRSFRRGFVVDVSGLGQLALTFQVLVGLTKDGVFPGSRVCSPVEDGIEHAAVECWRNFHAAKRLGDLDVASDIVTLRVCYFSRRKEEALSQIGAAQAGDKHQWHLPRLRLHRRVETDVPGVLMWRSLCEDFVGWHVGPVDRFVY